MVKPLFSSILLTGLMFLSHSLLADDFDTTLCVKELKIFQECIKVEKERTCRQAIIKAYSQDLYSPINATMRGFISNTSCLKVANILKEALLELPGINISVYRGTKLVPELKQMIAHYQSGFCFTDSAFISTSQNLAIAQSFATGEALLHIKARDGRNISEISAFSTEQEVLIPPHKWFLLTKQPEAGENPTLFEFREVLETQCTKKVHLLPNIPFNILVRKATYGGSSATKEAGDFCNNKAVCPYSVSNSYLKDPSPDEKKSFSVTWSCVKGTSVTGPFVKTIPAPATDSQFDFGCTPSGRSHFKAVELNPDYVHVQIVSAMTSTKKDITSLVEGKMTEKASVLPLSLSSTELELNEEEIASTATVTFKCVKKKTAFLKKVKMKNNGAGNLSGDLSCLDQL
jgi:hypothetical protein